MDSLIVQIVCSLLRLCDVSGSELFDLAAIREDFSPSSSLCGFALVGAGLAGFKLFTGF